MRLLIVGSLEGHIATASQIALSRGAAVVHVDDIEMALKTLRAGRGADLILMDVHLSVRTLVNALKTERFFISIVACGVDTSKELAIEAIRAGAKEYLPLPPDADLIAAVLETVAREDKKLIAFDPLMKDTIRLAEQIAPSDASVLISGESGTGKEVIARHIHEKSRRHQKPFISINCAAIPENLLESELFGHEKGAFTGAVARRIGKFEEANGGTLLLDEISEMDFRLQAKLLRAIQEREIDRVGGTKPVSVDIRILATSNRDLEAEVRQGNFREDLYFRLNVVSMPLPALRERPLDIEPLCQHFLKKYAESNNMPIRFLTSDALELLISHPWRGNVRELENIMHRATLLASGDVIDQDVIQLSGIKIQKLVPKVEAEIYGSQQRNFVGRTVAEVEKDLIVGTLNHCLGNRTQAAHILGISIRTLRNKLHQYSGTTDPTKTDYQIAG